MASARIASGVHGFGHAAFSSQNEALCCVRRDFLNAQFARKLHHHNGCCASLHSERTKARHLNAISNGEQPSSNEDDDDDDDSAADGFSQVNHDAFRKNLENIIGDNDASFCGKDLAMLIRNKYGRSYDVQLIKKEFMGRQLLAMNVMWKYREQRSFPLTEEEYLLHLDDVANNLRCWGAVSYVRNSLAKTKDRPRIGKAVSIFIDLDESGGRANEWIYR